MELMIVMLSLFVSTVQVPSRVESLHAEALSPTSAQVSWEPPSHPNGPILGYRLLWTENPSGKEQVSTTIPVSKWKHKNATKAT